MIIYNGSTGVFVFSSASVNKKAHMICISYVPVQFWVEGTRESFVLKLSTLAAKFLT